MHYRLGNCTFSHMTLSPCHFLSLLSNLICLCHPLTNPLPLIFLLLIALQTLPQKTHASLASSKTCPVFDNGIDAACACGVPLHIAMTRLCRLSKSAGICAGRSSCSVLWAVAVAAWHFWCWWPQCCGNNSGDGKGDNSRCWQQWQQRLERSHCQGGVM